MLDGFSRDFPAIGSSGVTSDQGWGCMLRCGQMVVGSALLNLRQGPSWVWSSDTRDPGYLGVVELFQDLETAPYSVHRIALMGESVDRKPVGTWFGPNTVAQVLREMEVNCSDDQLSGIRTRCSYLIEEYNFRC